MTTSTSRPRTITNDHSPRRWPERLLLAPAALSLLFCAGCDDSGSVATRDLSGAVPDMAGTVEHHLTLLYSNDEHSHLFAFGPEVDDYPTATMAGTGVLRGGVARRQVVLARERAAATAAGVETLTVSAGDNAMGTLAQAEFSATSPDYAIMKQLGYDVGCLGNHEFDFGPAALAQAVSAATAAGGAPQLVASNIHFSASDPADDTLAALYGEGTDKKPIKRYHVITTAGGLRVGFFGVLGADAAFNAPFKTPVTASGSAAEESNIEIVRPKIYADIQPTVDALRTVEKVDLVVALSHGGLDLDRPENGDDYNIAKNVGGIDVIVSGHSHTVVPQPIVVKNVKTNADVIVVQAGSFGRYVGRLALTVSAHGAVSFDKTASVLLPVDDTIVPDSKTAMAVETVVKDLESAKLASGSSFLESAVSRVAGMKVTDDPAKVGDLYFFKLGQTAFSIAGLGRFVETNVLNLSSDAQLAAATALMPMDAPDLAVQAAGVIRADIDKGKTGALTFGDAFRTFPLGFSPADGSVGYPVVHAYLYLAEIKAAFELSSDLGLKVDSFFLGASGMRVTVDTSRPAFDAKLSLVADNGRVTKIEWDSQHRVGADLYDTVLFDLKRADPWTSGNISALSLLHVVTNLYIAAFAASAGVKLKDKAGLETTLAKSIVRRADGTELKDYEAFAGYLKSLSDGNGGTLPARYDGTTPSGKLPRRNICTGPLCGKY